MRKFVPPVAISLLFASSILIGAQAQEPSVQPAANPLVFPRAAEDARQWGLVEEYCMGCHFGDTAAGGLDLESMSASDISAHPEVFEKIIRKVRGHMMPPSGAARPDNAALDSFASWVEDTLDFASAQHADPGRVGLHRLNRREYANAVRDLLNLEVDPAALLPQDDSYEGFDNIADALQVSPTFLDQYLSAARIVSVQAIGQPQARPASGYYTPANDEGNRQTQHVEGLPFGTRGGLVANHYFPSDGDYEVNIADIANGLYFIGMDYPHELIVVLDGKEMYRTVIGGFEDSRAIDQLQGAATDAINSRLKGIKFKATAGFHTIGVTFVHRSFAESESDLVPVSPGSGVDRLPRITAFEVRGPFNPTGYAQTPTRDKIFTCRPANVSQEAACADQILGQIARRAYRRPLNDADLAQLRTFYQSGREAGGFDEGIRAGLTRILASPDFLYRVEEDPPSAVPGSVHQLSDLELASRLSFFLWSSIPDDELLDLAAANRLSEPGVMEAQVMRMLQDPKAEALTTGFAFQWLHVAKLDDVVADDRILPAVSFQREQIGFDGDPRKEMKEELKLFIAGIFREDRNVLDLMTAEDTYLNERLAFHYRIYDVKGDRFRKVILENPERRGLLGKGALLMATSYPNRTSPVLRGAFILETITGTPMSAPPPNVEALAENTEGKVLTLRERMEVHRAAPSCHGCHAVMDPLGFALENFDATGVWRENDADARVPIDAAATLPDGTPINGVNELREALTARPEQFVQNFTEKLMLYALARPVESADMRVVRQIVRDTAKDDHRFSAIVMGIVNSDLFQKRSVPLPAGNQQAASETSQVAAR